MHHFLFFFVLGVLQGRPRPWAPTHGDDYYYVFPETFPIMDGGG